MYDTREAVQSQIFTIRGKQVMMDKDLAEMYGVETKQLKRQVKRNIDRFPNDEFMFELTTEEYNSLRSQFGTLKPATAVFVAWGRKGDPAAFQLPYSKWLLLKSGMKVNS